jgi:hypothetical protein
MKGRAAGPSEIHITLLIQLVRLKRRIFGFGNIWQQMAADGQHPGSRMAADWQQMAAGVAAFGSGMAAEWQRLAAFRQHLAAG